MACHTLPAQRFLGLQRISIAPLMAVLLLSLGVGEQTATAQPPSSSIPIAQNQLQQPPANAPLPPRVARRVKQEIAERYHIPRRALQVVQFSQETWTDGCLGLGAPNEGCMMALVDGWRVEITNGQQNWVYRTDKLAQTIRPEEPQATNLPSEVSDRLLQTIAREENVPLESLRVAEAQSATWNGCMGIFEPGQACTQIAMPGWRAIVTDGDRSWVYHLTQDGSRIVQNVAASGSRGGLVPSFMPPDQADGNQGAAIVFYFRQAGGLGGSVSERILMADGTLYHDVRQPNTLPPTDPVIEKRLSPEQVEQFRQVLLQQKFPSLSGLRYVSSASLADYPTTTLKGLGSTVDYTDLELEHLPPALQTVIRAWEQL